MLEDDGRGWCTFESAVSSELLVRLQAYPRLRATLEPLPPKLLELSRARPPRPIDLAEEALEGREGRVVERIRQATFTLVVDLQPDE